MPSEPKKKRQTNPEKPSAASRTKDLPFPDKGRAAGSVVETVPPPNAKELFSQFRDTVVELALAEDGVKKARVRKSDAVRAIRDAFGSGPFRVDGKVLVIRERYGGCYFCEETTREIRELDLT